MLRRGRDLSGCATAMQSLLFTLALTGVTLVPYFAGLSTGVYLVGAILLDAGMIFFAVQFLFQRNRPSARRLFFTSIMFSAPDPGA